MKSELRREITDVITAFVASEEVQTVHQPVQILRTMLLGAVEISKLSDRHQKLTQSAREPFKDLLVEQIEAIMRDKGYQGIWISGNSGYVYQKRMEQRFLPL